MNKRKIPVYQVSGEYADCLEKTFLSRKNPVPGAASEGTGFSRDSTLGGIMGNTPPSLIPLGQISEDTAYLSVWVNWGSDADTLFARLKRCQLESQGRAETEAAELESVAEPMEMDEFGSFPGETQLEGGYIEGSGDGYIELGDTLWKVMPYGKRGKSEGRTYFPFWLANGGVSIFLRRDAQETVSNMWVEFGSIPLATLGGLENAWNELKASFCRAKITVMRELVSRVDVYADFDMCEVGEFCERFFNDARVSRARVIGVYQDEELNTAMYMNGRKMTGFSIGKDIKLRCYDKRYEMRNDPLKWGVFAERYGGRVPDVLTRVEFQLRREALKEVRVGTGRVDDVASYLSVRESLWKYLTTEWFRLTEEKIDKKYNHHSRARTWSVWETVQNAVGTAVACAERVKRAVVIDATNLFKQAYGCAMKAALFERGALEAPVDFMRFIKTKIEALGPGYYLDALAKHQDELSLRMGGITGLQVAT